jgi:hypothetical protein
MRNKKARACAQAFFSSGAEGDRTPDLCIANAALSQLSYNPEPRLVDGARYVTRASLPGKSLCESSTRAYQPIALTLSGSMR